MRTARKPIPLSDAEQNALLILSFIVQTGVWSWPSDRAFLARLTERLRAAGAFDRSWA
jgi:hypothetical protein